MLGLALDWPRARTRGIYVFNRGLYVYPRGCRERSLASECQTTPAAEVPLLRRIAVASGGSIRTARKLISMGRVFVDGARCDDLLAVVATDNHVECLCPDEKKRGMKLKVVAPPTHDFYLKLYKPRGVLCTHKHEQLSTKPILPQFFPKGTHDILHMCGRLDGESEGLLLLTSDGAFTRFVLMPETRCEKEYIALIRCAKDKKPPSDAVLEQLCEGVKLADGLARARVAEVVDFDGRFARLRIVVTEGRFRMVRRMLRAVQYSCLQLLRTRVASIEGVPLRPEVLADAGAEALNPPKPEVVAATLGTVGSPLQPGEFLPLLPAEVIQIYRAGLAWLDEHHPLG